MNNFTHAHKDKIWLLGILLLVVSLVMFLVPILLHNDDAAGGIFMINYLIALVYLTFLLAYRRLKRGNQGLPLLFILLILCLISCYSLNREIPVFEDSVDWWCILLVLINLNYLTFQFYNLFPLVGKLIICFLAGIGFMAFVYLSFSLFPVYLFGAIGIIALGIGAHAFVPLLLVIYNLVFVTRATKEDKRVIFAWLGGVILVIGIAIQFTLQWGSQVKKIDQLLFQPGNPINKDLPAWVSIAQQLSPNTYNERFLKAGLVYESAENWDFFSWTNHNQFNERKQHDPLIALACHFYGRSDLQDNDRIKILESMYDSRQQAQERLWNGEDLATTDITTRIELWPQQHLSYTEETLTVTNQKIKANFNSPAEALYSFHLPEGAVISSLSLWINGKEQNALLSSRHKADSAYTSIVGYENRDPCVLHWQEGNIVTVRVFPVQPQESRHFKIGITAPLQKVGTRLIYHSTYFDGPPADNASSSIHLRSIQTLQHPDNLPSSSETYHPDWSLSFDDPGLSNSSFSFNGYRYHTSAYVHQYAATDIQNIYLDLNKSWTHEQYTQLLQALPGKKIFALQPSYGIVELNNANKEEVFTECAREQFSLFPVYLIDDKAHSLLISKSPPVGPMLSDLNKQDFSDSLKTFLGKPGQLMLFNLGEGLSPYLKSLKEMGAFQFDQGDIPSLISHINNGNFIQSPDKEELALIDPAGLLIARSNDTSQRDSQPAPDHLLRLFAYHRIMQQLQGQLPGDYRAEDPTTLDSLVQIADEAHIVSPVSSLIVLETKDDYKKFNIVQSKNSLKNASLQSKGAVPEPGEWALIVLCAGIFTCEYFRKKRQNISL